MPVHSFNGARSGVNFNDAFGVGSVVSRNTLFNLNRETADHGCFNSWDRIPFSISKDAQNKDLLERNMLLSNFNSYNGIDTDDDSAYFLMRRNVLLYGHMLKSDFSGHDNYWEGDLGVFVGPSNQYQPVPPDHLNSLKDVTIVNNPGDGTSDNLWKLVAPTCNGTTRDFPMIESVKIYSHAGKTTICGVPVASFKPPPGKGYVRNVTTGYSAALTAAEIVRMARETLNRLKSDDASIGIPGLSDACSHLPQRAQAQRRRADRSYSRPALAFPQRLSADR